MLDESGARGEDLEDTVRKSYPSTRQPRKGLKPEAVYTIWCIHKAYQGIPQPTQHVTANNAVTGPDLKVCIENEGLHQIFMPSPLCWSS